MARKMKRDMKSRRMRRQVLRRTKRHTAVGRIFPPVDVRNKSGLNEVLKRIKAGPITIMLVYADWCGHCKDFKPHFDAAARTPDRTVQTVKVSEPMVEEVNSAIKSMNASAAPLSVDAYPTVLLLDNKGNSITEINAVKDTESMKKVMKEAGRNAEEVALSTPKPPAGSAAPPSLNVFAEEAASMNKRGSRTLPTDPTMNAINSLPPVVSTRSQTAEEVAGNIVQPPGGEEDLINMGGPGGSPQKGGSLYSAMASSAYRLAPAAVLLGLAAATTMRSGRGKGRGQRRGRKTLRRGRK